MKVVHSDSFDSMRPQAEVSTSTTPQPVRALGPRGGDAGATLAADARFESAAPQEWGTGPMETVHNPGLVRFLSEAWELYNAEYPGHPRSGARRVGRRRAAHRDGPRA